jgi:hypothetical protein
MLGEIRAATLVCGELSPAVAPYLELLGCRSVERGRVPEALASAWDAPAVAGCRYEVLAPASGADTYLRFVEVPGSAPYAPCSARGWHALELTVSDCDAATAALLKGPFRLLGPPHDLDFAAGALRAAQLAGPSGEVLYLTHVRAQVPGFVLPTATTLIDRLFIAVLHVPSAADGLAWYAREFGNPAGETFPVPIDFMARLHGLPEDHPYRIGTLALAPGYYLELDDTPDHVPARPRPAGGLPPGIAMLSVVAPRSAEPPTAPATGAGAGGPIYADVRGISRRAGPGGEWIELLHRDIP